jgi:phenylpyruvate tautomerase
MSIGKLGIEENKKHAALLYDYIEKNLGIPRNRLYITFTGEDAANVGYNGTTFHQTLVEREGMLQLHGLLLCIDG